MGLNDTRETAAFNLALPYLMRVNSVLNSNYTAFRNGDNTTFAINLRQLSREIYPWLLVKKGMNGKPDIDEVTPLKEAFEELARIPKNKRDKIWNKLEDIEMMLRLKFKELGMLMPKLSDPRFLFGSKQK